MPEGEGGEARGQTQLLSGDLTLVAEGPDGPVTFVFRVVRVEDFEVESSQHFLVVQRTARLAGSIRSEAAYEAPVVLESSAAAAAMAESAAVRASSFWLRDRIAEGSCPRGATRVARRARVRNATKDERRQALYD